MDKNFMEEYYKMKYIEGDICPLLAKDELFQNIFEKMSALQNKFESCLQDIGLEYSRQFDELMELYGKQEGILLKATYVMGAEDREKMLK